MKVDLRKSLFILPNLFTADVSECFLILSGYGDLGSERAYLRTEAISCVRRDGGAIEVPVDGYAVGEDGKAGVRGRVVSKQGAAIARAMQVSFLQGFSQFHEACRRRPIAKARLNGAFAQQQLALPLGNTAHHHQGVLVMNNPAGGAHMALEAIAPGYFKDDGPTAVATIVHVCTSVRACQ